MVQKAVLIGIDPIRFWDYTPKEISFLFDTYVQNEKKKVKDIISLAWCNAKLHNVKRLPKLEKLLNNKDTKKMSNEAMLEKVKQLNKLFGGEIITR